MPLPSRRCALSTTPAAPKFCARITSMSPNLATCVGPPLAIYTSLGRSASMDSNIKPNGFASKRDGSPYSTGASSCTGMARLISTMSLRKGRICPGSIGYRKPSCSITSLTGGVESSFRIQPNSSSSDFHCVMSSSLDRTDWFTGTISNSWLVCHPALKLPGGHTGIFLASPRASPSTQFDPKRYYGRSPWLVSWLVRVAVKRSLAQPPAWVDALYYGDSGLL